MNIEKIDSLKLANSIPSENDKTNMIAKLVCETADLQKENQRLNNIIKELEKESYLGMIENQNNNDYSKGLYTAYKYINDKLQELKGSESNEWRRTKVF